MASYEVTFTVYTKIFPSGSTTSNPNMTGQKTVVQANNALAARQLVETQYGPNCKTFGARQL